MIDADEFNSLIKSVKNDEFDHLPTRDITYFKRFRSKKRGDNKRILKILRPESTKKSNIAREILSRINQCSDKSRCRYIFCEKCHLLELKRSLQKTDKEIVFEREYLSMLTIIFEVVKKNENILISIKNIRQKINTIFNNHTRRQRASGTKTRRTVIMGAFELDYLNDNHKYGPMKKRLLDFIGWNPKQIEKPILITLHAILSCHPMQKIKAEKILRVAFPGPRRVLIKPSFKDMTPGSNVFRILNYVSKTRCQYVKYVGKDITNEENASNQNELSTITTNMNESDDIIRFVKSIHSLKYQNLSFYRSFQV